MQKPHHFSFVDRMRQLHVGSLVGLQDFGYHIIIVAMAKRPKLPTTYQVARSNKQPRTTVHGTPLVHREYTSSMPESSHKKHGGMLGRSFSWFAKPDVTGSGSRPGHFQQLCRIFDHLGSPKQELLGLAACAQDSSRMHLRHRGLSLRV